ncbi:MAG: hypothetical protein N2117_00530 [Anaerolineales bacterium]|nr:hypothetical protein [Anaerolineales bacterium]
MMKLFESLPRSSFWFYVLAFGLALAVRLIRLDAWPLTEEEARWAMQAFEMVQGLRPEIGAHPGYVLFTALAFFVFQASEFTARLAPAVFGAALVIAPALFQDRLGEKPALVLAFLLALDPGFLAISRLAGSPVLAVSALVLAWGAWRNGFIPAAGILAGLALLGGPQIWPGLLGLAISAGLFHRFFAPGMNERPLRRAEATRALLYTVGTILTVGTLFLLSPGSLSGLIQSLSAYLSGWFNFDDTLFAEPGAFVPASRLLIALGVYTFPALLLAVITLVRGILQRDALTLGLGIWFGVALILALANPARQVFDLAWPLLPLLALAALEAARHLRPAEGNVWETASMMAFTLSLLFFVGSNFSGLALNTLTVEQTQIRLLLLLAGLVMLIVSIFLVAYGWSVPVAVQGSIWGGLVILLVWHLSTAMAAGGLRAIPTAEMWPPGLPVRYSHALTEQLREVERWKWQPAQPLTITVSGVESAALRWALRDWKPDFTFAATLTETPDVLITPVQQESPALAESYRGQDFIWRTQTFWDELQPTDWLRWIFRHQTTEGQEALILWVRNDLFPDSQP